MLVFLVGYMGSGKSTIGRKLASSVGFDFIDTDKEIEKRCGASVGEIFEREGEAQFRKMETEFLENLDRVYVDAIVATGGGMPCTGGNMELMNRLGMTVYLRFSPEKLVPRLAGGRDKRPKIRGMNDLQLLEFITSSLGEREQYYAKSAVVVDGDGAGDDYMCRFIGECIAWEIKRNSTVKD